MSVQDDDKPTVQGLVALSKMIDGWYRYVLESVRLLHQERCVHDIVCPWDKYGENSAMQAVGLVLRDEIRYVREEHGMDIIELMSVYDAPSMAARVFDGMTITSWWDVARDVEKRHAAAREQAVRRAREYNASQRMKALADRKGKPLDFPPGFTYNGGTR